MASLMRQAAGEGRSFLTPLQLGNTEGLPSLGLLSAPPGASGIPPCRRISAVLLPPPCPKMQGQRHLSSSPPLPCIHLCPCLFLFCLCSDYSCFACPCPALFCLSLPCPCSLPVPVLPVCVLGPAWPCRACPCPLSSLQTSPPASGLCLVPGAVGTAGGGFVERMGAT